MKSFRWSIIALILCVSVVISMSEANAAIRVGLLTVHVMGNNMPNPSSMSGYREYQKIQKHYADILIEAFAKNSYFEAVKFNEKEYNALMSKATKELGTAAAKGKRSVYRPTYNRSMNDTSNLFGRYSDEEIKRQQRILAAPQFQLAKQNNCRYIIEASLQIDDAYNAVAHLWLSDVEKMERMSDIYSSGEANSSFVRKAVDKNTKTSTKSKGKTKSKKDSVEQSNNDSAALEAFVEAIANLQDALSGEVTKIVKIEGNNIIINKGASSNFKIGKAFLVTAEANDGMDDIFGKDTDTNKVVNIAIIKIKDIQEDVSIAEVIPDGGNIKAIRVEDNLAPISQSNINSYLSSISEGKIYPFPDKHPEVKKAEVKPAESNSTATTATKNNSKSKNEKTSVAKESLPALPPDVMRIGVMNFDSKTDGVSSEEASSLTDLLSRMLSTSDKIVVLERDSLETIAREQKLNLVGIINPSTAAQLGKLASCQYILLGSVTGRSESDTISGQYIRPTERADYSRFLTPNISSTGAGILLGLQVISMISEANNAKKENVVTETHEVITDVDVRLVNVQTSQITMAFTEQGSAAQSDVVTQDGNGEIKGVDANYGSLENRALASAAANISNKVREILTDEKLQVSSVNNDEIIINRGSSSGIQVDDLFCVYTDGQSGGDTEAIISVKDVQEAFSTAELAKSLSDSYSVIPGSRLENVLHSDFQKGIWHIKNQKRAQSSEKNKQDVSLEELTTNVGKRKRFETSSTDTKKVIKSYGLDPNKEKALINAHSKAAKASNSKKKYEAYKLLSNADVNDFLAAYNTGKYALEQSMYMEAREWASKALFINPNYKPAQNLIAKIDNGD